MTAQQDFTAPAFNRFGAQHGRRSADPCSLDTSERLTLQRVRLDRGGYDAGGAYWGLGAPLYWCSDEAGSSFYLRAGSRDQAKRIIRASAPGARFYR